MNGDVIQVPLTSRECAGWCVIAKFSNDVNDPTIINLNKETDSEPAVGDF